MLKLNIKLLISPPKKKKLTMAHLSSSVDRDRRPWLYIYLYDDDDDDDYW